MESKTKQAREYERMLELTFVPPAERQNVMSGAAVFFDRGWPINHFTVEMAARVGMGQIPPAYNGIGSEGRYFQAMKDQDQLAGSACQLAALDFASNYSGDRLIQDCTEPRGCREWHRTDGSIEQVKM